MKCFVGIRWESANTIYGGTSNPYDTNRIVGGSSGGEACLLVKFITIFSNKVERNTRFISICFSTLWTFFLEKSILGSSWISIWAGNRDQWFNSFARLFQWHFRAQAFAEYCII